MDRNIPKSYLGMIVALGAVWGLSETALGIGLRKCASLMSGSLMTGVALFFIAASWVITRRILAVALLIVTATLFKMFDAILLSLPLQHGAIANPIFAFFMEGAAFLFYVMIIKGTLGQKKSGQALLGGACALVAVSLFPLVKFVTGIPACVFPGKAIPLSIYFAPVAVAISTLTVPLGFWAGEKIKAASSRLEIENRKKTLKLIVSPVTLVLSLAIITLIRLIIGIRL